MLAFAVVLSVAFIELAYSTTATSPGGTIIEVDQGDVFLLRGTVTFDKAATGYFCWGPVYWYHYGDPTENFTVENISVYWNSDNTPVENVSISDYETPDGHQIEIKHSGSGIERNGTFTIDVWLRAASGDGTPHRPMDNHPIYYAMDTITLWEPNTVVITAKPVTIRVRELSAIIYPSDDAHVNERWPDRNYGSNSSIWVCPRNNRTKRGFLKFDLSEIPPNANVQQAKLHLNCSVKKHDNFDAACCEVENDVWSENTITWNNQPSYDNSLDVVEIIGVGWYTWDVTSFVGQEFGGDKIVSFCLKGAVEPHGGRAVFVSKEWHDNHPYLEFKYVLSADNLGQKGSKGESLAKFDENLRELMARAENNPSVASENVIVICYTGFPDTSVILEETETRFDAKIDNILEKVRIEARRISAELGLIEENILRGEEKALERMRGLEAAAGIRPNDLRRLNENVVEPLVEQRRKFIRESLEQLCRPTWERLEFAIESLGGEIKVHAPGITAAKVRVDRLRELSAIPEVIAVYHDAPLRLGLNVSVPTIGADNWWGGTPPENGYPHEVLVVDLGIDEDHYGLEGRVVANRGFPDPDTYFIENILDPRKRWMASHGTGVAGVIASMEDPWRGVAYGANLINACLNGWAGIEGSWFSDVVDAVQWALELPDGPEVINTSITWEDEYPNPDGNSYATRYLDFVVNSYDISWAQCAGNIENGDVRIIVPADSYNAIVVGAMDDKNTVVRGDDNLPDFSRRGPTLDGRIKPDLVAPGVAIHTCWHDWHEGGFPIYSDENGTSFSAPHIAGAAALLRSYYSKPYAIKALLLNTSDDWGPSGPDNAYGYGYVNLEHAYIHKGDVWTDGYLDSVGPREYRFYKGPWHGSEGDKATLVWNKPIWSEPEENENNPLGLCACLAFSLYDEENGELIDHQGDVIHNAKQVRSSSDFPAVLKVQADDLQGVPGSFVAYALATEESFSRASPPVLWVSIDAPTSVTVGDTFTVDAQVSNQGDITAFGVQATLNLPVGLTLISGSNPQGLGSINGGSPSIASWEVKAESRGFYTISVSADSSSYGEYYVGSDFSNIEAIEKGNNIAGGTESAYEHFLSDTWGNEKDNCRGTPLKGGGYPPDWQECILSGGDLENYKRIYSIFWKVKRTFYGCTERTASLEVHKMDGWHTIAEHSIGRGGSIEEEIELNGQLINKVRFRGQSVLCPNLQFAQWWVYEIEIYEAYVVPPWAGTATYELENLYKVSLEKDLQLNTGSKLVVKFYKYDNATLQMESVIDNITPPENVKENENVPHPRGAEGYPWGTVQIARLVLTTDNTDEVISEIASFTVHQSDLRDRYIDILIDWSAHPELHDAFRDEIIDILIQWSSAPP
jgi:serine protease AprX